MRDVARRKRIPKSVFKSVLVLGTLGLIEGISVAAGTFLSAWTSIDLRPTSELYQEQRQHLASLMGSDTNDVFHPFLCWTYRPNFRNGTYTNNSAGLRGRREYDLVPPPGVTRLAAFGDSFVYGSEVADEAVWSRCMEQMFPGLEVLNFGVGGYGTDQAYLRYLTTGRWYGPHIVLIGFVSVDLARNVNVYRRFLVPSDRPHFKPRFRLSPNGELVLLPSPVQSSEELRRYYEEPERVVEVGANDLAYRPLIYENPLYDYSATVRLTANLLERVRRLLTPESRLYNGDYFNPDSEAFQVTLAILVRFAQEVKADGAVPLVLMFPTYETVADEMHHRAKRYEPLTDALCKMGVEVVDLADAFRVPTTEERHFMPGGHLSPESNRIVARFLSEYLAGRKLVTGAGMVPRSTTSGGC